VQVFDYISQDPGGSRGIGLLERGSQPLQGNEHGTGKQVKKRSIYGGRPAGGLGPVFPYQNTRDNWGMFPLWSAWHQPAETGA
jgi:hypothetical protein